LAARFAGCAVNGDPLAVEVDVFHRYGYSLFPAEPGERHRHGDVAQALLEVVESFGEPHYLGNAGGEHTPPHRTAPAGAQL
jgi:hypothetical protein